MKSHKDDCDSTQLVLERLVLDQLMNGQRAGGDKRSPDKRSPDKRSQDKRLPDKRLPDKRSAGEQPRRCERRRDPARRDAPRRPRFEPVRLLTPSSWRGKDFMTLGLGAVLIVGLFVAVGQGIGWVILPGAAAVIFAMISTQLRWGPRPRVRRLQHQQAARGAETGARRSMGGEDTGGIVQLPTRKDSKRRTG